MMSVTAHAYEHLDCSNPECPLIAGKNFKEQGESGTLASPERIFPDVWLNHLNI